MNVAPAWDVIVVGAGPGGSTTAALLAKRGHRVLVLEKEQFPRFHIGESLLPAGLSIHERLGMDPRSDVFVFKAGAEFVCEQRGIMRRFLFGEALPGCPRFAYHVERSHFDTFVRDRALAFGADVRHGERVVDVDFRPDRVVVRTNSGREEGRFLVDATGQDRMLAELFGSVQPFTEFGRAAAFTHFNGISDAALEEIGPGNEIRIVLRPEGWAWIILLPGRRLSLGIVGQRKVSPELLEQGLLSGPLARRWTAGAERQATRVIRNFSYRNARPSGLRFAAVGDAACFLDPVFSSGVTLAMQGGESLADRLGPALDAGREGEPELMQAHCTHMDRAYRTFAGLIDRFYNTRFVEAVFMRDTADRTLQPGLMSVLAGDVFRSDNPFQELLLRARRRSGRTSAVAGRFE